MNRDQFLHLLPRLNGLDLDQAKSIAACDVRARLNLEGIKGVTVVDKKIVVEPGFFTEYDIPTPRAPIPSIRYPPRIQPPAVFGGNYEALLSNRKLRRVHKLKGSSH